ncbi:MAG: hypothetical protein JO286_00005, partial [Solirubrobacterales bacterium]|nr:hypothetical protein [Solirubrobacterales bacterium]
APDAGPDPDRAATRPAVDPDPDPAREAIEYCYEKGWTDGLPVVPASAELVDQFLAHTARDPDEVLWRMEHLGRECTVRTAAINAAMAGCLPEYFPIVLAAWDAVMRDRAAKGGGWQSTSGPAPLIVINGPIRGELGINCTGGIFAGGFRPNATIPRALGLMLRNAFGVVPHVFDQTTQGIPGRWSICFGENEEESPWEPLAVETGLQTGVNAVSCTLTRTYEFVDNRHTQDPEQLLNDFADTLGRIGSLIFRGQSAGVVFCPEHAQMLANAGMSKGDVKDWFIEHVGRTEADLRRAGKDGVSASGPGARSASESERAPADTFTPYFSARKDVPIIVAGARNAAISMVFRVFGEWSNISVPIESARAPAAAVKGG